MPPSLRDARPLRILYEAGPGDVATTYAYWKAGNEDPSQVAITYSGQFYDVCKQLGAEALVISSSPKPGDVRDGPYRIINRPILFSLRGGALYHLGQIWSEIRSTISAVRFGADVAIVSNGVHWFSLRAFPLLGIKVIPTLHCVFWPLGKPPSGLGGFVQRLNARFLRKHAAGFLCVSSEIAEQLQRLTGRTDATVFTPTYRRDAFDNPPPAPPASPPFRVMYAGRVERTKGVFTLVDIAKRFALESRTEIEFDVCGSGSALDALRLAVDEAGVAPRFRLHGHCERARMRRMYRDAHVIIVPTTSDFVEGFNKVVAEGVLAGRPVITSSVCPALRNVRDAVIEVPVDDTSAYGDAILSLQTNPALYAEKVAACAKLREQFLDPDNSWASAVIKHTQIVTRQSTTEIHAMSAATRVAFDKGDISHSESS